MKLNRHRLNRLASKGHQGAKLAERLLEKPDRLLGLILLGNNFINILIASLATLLALRLYGEAAIAIATGLLTVIILIFAEVSPKTLATRHPEPIAFFAAYLYTPLLHRYSPLIWLVNIIAAIANTVLRLYPGHAAPSTSDQFGTDEIKSVLENTEGLMPELHRHVLINILNLEGATVNDFMVPRNEIVAIDLTDEIPEIREQILNTTHGTLPAYRSNPGDVCGFINLKEISKIMSHRSLDIELIESHLDDVHFIPENTPLITQLLHFLSSEKTTGLVLDEYGEIVGLISIDDILKAVAGRIESDQAAKVSLKEDGNIMIYGNANLRHLQQIASIDVPLDGPKTLNGLVLEQLEEIPVAGMKIPLGEHTIEILEVAGNTIKLARIMPSAASQQPES